MVTRAILVALCLTATAAAQTAPAPVVVVPLPGEGLTEDVANAVMETVPAGLRPVVERREVRAATDIVAGVLACEDAACRGGQIATAGGSAGVFVTVSRARADGPVMLHFEVLDAVTGTPRGEPVDAEVPAEAATDPAQMVVALAPAFQALTAQMPSPPVRAMFLVAANVDGAAVSVDGEARGETPIAPLELEPGTHTVSVTRRGYQPFNRSVEVSIDGGRLNVDLEPAPEIAQAMQQEDAAQAEDFVSGAPASKPLYKEWWLWAAVGGAVVLITTIAVIAAVAGGGGGGQGFEIPPIPEGM